jgi:hypothetical protein
LRWAEKKAVSRYNQGESAGGDDDAARFNTSALKRPVSQA